jgi:electron transfer flavoprotein beta subunit
MQVVVLLAGVVDPKWRLAELALRPGTSLVNEAGLPRRLSPFDESALEIALRLRDADPGTRITVALFGGEESQGLLRAVAAFRPQRAFLFGGPDVSLWDPRAATGILRAALSRAEGRPDLVLMGREFGDSDDGVLPPALAEAAGLHFCGQIHSAAMSGGELAVRRTRGPREEMLRLPPPALVSITNERGNRLRHPLMKNVMLAKREPAEMVTLPMEEANTLKLLGIAPVAPPRRRGADRRILTGPVEEQVCELAAYLRKRLLVEAG